MISTPSSFKMNDNLYLEADALHHAAELTALAEANREHLKPFLVWAHVMHTEDQFLGFLQQSILDQQSYGFSIWQDGQMIGRISIVNMSKKNQTCEIGYWLSVSYQGKGIVTMATQTLMQYAFETMQMHRIEIKCATNNHKSAAVPKRLGFTFEGTLRQAEKYAEGYRDLALWSKLSNEK